MENVLGFSCLLLAVAAASGASVRTTDAEDDLITDLPGIDTSLYDFKQYSGYLDAENNLMLHYWFTESQSNPDDDPLLLWMNGGPGCSSLDGLLSELGPFHVDEDDATSLYINEYSWNTFANVLFLESPGCVGFSYGPDDTCDASDNSTAVSNYNALLQFFERFPERKTNDFYVTGESYAGIYVPSLTLQIILNNEDNDDPINLQGFAVGNGVTDNSMNADSLMFFANYHGLFDQDFWEEMIQECCQNKIISTKTCEFSTSDYTSNCYKLVVEGQIKVYSPILDHYNLYAECYHPSQSALLNTMLERLPEEVRLAMESISTRDISDYNITQPLCVESDKTAAYLNNQDVKNALHIVPESPVWQLCSDTLNYTVQYESMAETYLQIRDAGIRGLVYNGDVDMACNFIGDQWFVESLGYTKTEDRRPWYLNNTVGGWVKQFELMDLLTVRGSGHMVPGDKPAEALHMIKTFIEKTDY